MLILIDVILLLVLAYLFIRYRIVSQAIKKSHLEKDWTGEFWVGSKSKPEFSVLILGDSIAAGIGVNEFEKTLGGLLAKKLSSQYHVRLVNRAQSGVWLSGLAQEEVEKGWDLIVVVAGSNELTHRLSPRFVRLNLNRLLRHLNGKARYIILEGPGNVGSTKILPFWVRYPIHFRQRDFAHMMGKLALEHGVLYANPLKHEAKPGYFASDHIHPNSLGHHSWFELLWEQLEPVLKSGHEHHYFHEPLTENTFLNDLLFWLHTLIIFAILLSGLILSLPWVIFLIAVYFIHLYFFDGCIITKLEIQIHGIPYGMSYFQYAAKRFFHKRLTKHGAHVLTLILAISTISISILVNLNSLF